MEENLRVGGLPNGRLTKNGKPSKNWTTIDALYWSEIQGLSFSQLQDWVRDAQSRKEAKKAGRVRVKKEAQIKKLQAQSKKLQDELAVKQDELAKLQA